MKKLLKVNIVRLMDNFGAGEHKHGEGNKVYSNLEKLENFNCFEKCLEKSAIVMGLWRNSITFHKITGTI